MTPISQNQNETQSDKESETSTSLTPHSKKSTRRGNPKWVPGHSGNPVGRPKGSKNRISAQKLQIEEALRDQLNLEMPEILLKAIEMAKKGDRAMIKLLMELTMSKPVAHEEDTAGKEKVQINIRNLTVDQQASQPKFVNESIKFIDAKVLKDTEENGN